MDAAWHEAMPSLSDTMSHHIDIMLPWDGRTPQGTWESTDVALQCDNAASKFNQICMQTVMMYAKKLEKAGVPKFTDLNQGFTYKIYFFFHL